MSVDPVMPGVLSGMTVRTTLKGRPIRVRYQVGNAGCGVRSVELNGQPLTFRYADNPHRVGAAEIELEDFLSRVRSDSNELAVTLG